MFLTNCGFLLYISKRDINNRFDIFPNQNIHRFSSKARGINLYYKNIIYIYIYNYFLSVNINLIKGKY